MIKNYLIQVFACFHKITGIKCFIVSIDVRNSEFKRKIIIP